MYRIAFLLVAVGACGGGASTKTTNPEPAKPVLWKDMNLEQRTTYMKDVVLPKATELFSTQNPKYQSMTCETCHGDGATDGSFEMPNKKLPPLPNTEEAFIAWVSKDADAGQMA